MSKTQRDIVERLRDHANNTNVPARSAAVMFHAADEIERLRGIMKLVGLAETANEIERLRAALHHIACGQRVNNTGAALQGAIETARAALKGQRHGS
jgi:hypothetical protein